MIVYVNKSQALKRGQEYADKAGEPVVMVDRSNCYLLRLERNKKDNETAQKTFIPQGVEEQ